MWDWSSYSLADFLLFSPQVYERMFVLNNQDLWPLQFVVLAVAALVTLLVARGGSASGRALLVMLGIGWITAAGSFFLGRYQEINWLGAYIAPIAVIEGGLLILVAFMGRADLIDAARDGLVFRIGFALMAIGLLLYPLLAPALGSSIAAAQIFGVTADATAIATLGGLSLISSRVRFVAAVIPVLWGIFTVLTLSTLGLPDFFFVSGLFAISLIAVAWPRRSPVKGR